MALVSVNLLVFVSVLVTTISTHRIKADEIQTEIVESCLGQFEQTHSALSLEKFLGLYKFCDPMQLGASIITNSDMDEMESEIYRIIVTRMSEACQTTLVAIMAELKAKYVVMTNRMGLVGGSDQGSEKIVQARRELLVRNRATNPYCQLLSFVEPEEFIEQIEDLFADDSTNWAQRIYASYFRSAALDKCLDEFTRVYYQNKRRLVTVWDIPWMVYLSEYGEYYEKQETLDNRELIEMIKKGLTGSSSSLNGSKFAKMLAAPKEARAIIGVMNKLGVRGDKYKEWIINRLVPDCQLAIVTLKQVFDSDNFLQMNDDLTLMAAHIFRMARAMEVLDFLNGARVYVFCHLLVTTNRSPVQLANEQLAHI